LVAPAECCVGETYAMKVLAQPSIGTILVEGLRARVCGARELFFAVVPQCC
jgi:hypothetical protein